MTVLLDAFEGMFAGGCLLAMNFVLMFLFGLLRNLPAILRAGREALRELLTLSFHAYKPVMAYLQPVALEHLGIQIARTSIRVLCTTAFSLLILLTVELLLGWGFSVFLCVLAILHGVIVGLVWEGLDQAGAFRTGERIQ